MGMTLKSGRWITTPAPKDPTLSNIATLERASTVYGYEHSSAFKDRVRTGVSDFLHDRLNLKQVSFRSVGRKIAVLSHRPDNGELLRQSNNISNRRYLKLAAIAGHLIQISQKTGQNRLVIGGAGIGRIGWLMPTPSNP